MTIFSKYSGFYDLIYQDKDYDSECNFLINVFNRYTNFPVQSILDLGCGTGGHSINLAEKGYSVVGIDRSNEMLEIARRKQGSKKVSYHLGDITHIRLDRKFDVCIAMFAVMSYMTTNEKLSSAFASARGHIISGGLFIFDCWFGPGVYSDPPTCRSIVCQQNEKQLIRKSTPSFDAVEQIVDVRFDVSVIQSGKMTEKITEHHFMRPLFVQEVRQYAHLNSLKLVKVLPWFEIDREIKVNDWQACFVLMAL